MDGHMEKSKQLSVGYKQAHLSSNWNLQVLGYREASIAHCSYLSSPTLGTH